MGSASALASRLASASRSGRRLAGSSARGSAGRSPSGSIPEASSVRPGWCSGSTSSPVWAARRCATDDHDRNQERDSKPHTHGCRPGGCAQRRRCRSRSDVAPAFTAARMRRATSARSRPDMLGSPTHSPALHRSASPSFIGGIEEQPATAISDAARAATRSTLISRSGWTTLRPGVVTAKRDPEPTLAASQRTLPCGAWFRPGVLSLMKLRALVRLPPPLVGFGRREVDLLCWENDMPGSFGRRVSRRPGQHDRRPMPVKSRWA